MKKTGIDAGHIALMKRIQEDIVTANARTSFPLLGRTKPASQSKADRDGQKAAGPRK